MPIKLNNKGLVKYTIKDLNPVYYQAPFIFRCNAVLKIKTPIQNDNGNIEYKLYKSISSDTEPKFQFNVSSDIIYGDDVRKYYFAALKYATEFDMNPKYKDFRYSYFVEPTGDLAIISNSIDSKTLGFYKYYKVIKNSGLMKELQNICRVISSSFSFEVINVKQCTKSLIIKNKNKLNVGIVYAPEDDIQYRELYADDFLNNLY